MNTVKENSLNVEAAQTALMYLRLVVDRFTGDSKLVQIQDLELEVSNIVGLAALLAASQTLVTGHENEIPKFNALGQIEGSGINVGTFSTEAELAALVDDGTYTFVYDTAFVSLPLCGIVYFVAINNGHRILYTDNGLWHSVYFGGWGLERYIGGAFDNITISYADAVTQAAASQLSPGASYKITGTGQNLGLILRAASANEFESDGILLAMIPSHSIGTYDGIVWGGHWASNMATPTANHYYTFYGRVWKSVTGAIGTASNYGLDATNWLLIDPLSSSAEFYTQVTHGCSYKLISSMPLVYPTGFIFSRWDSKGNTLSEIVEDADGFTSDMNDWHLDIDGGQFNGNILRRIYNNTISSSNAIMRCSGNGDVYNTLNCDIIDCVLPDDTNNIRNVIGSSIVKNVLGGTADIQYLASGSNLSNNTINGDVKGDVSAYSTITLQNTTVGHTGEIKDNLFVSVTDSIIHGVIDSNHTAELINTIMDPFATVQLCTKAKLSKSRVTANGNIYACDYATFMDDGSVIDSTHSLETLTANRTITESRGQIISECYVGTGTFVVANGAAYVAPSSVTGCAKTEVRSNGIIQNGTTLADATFTAIYAGWYRVRCIASAHASFKCNFKTICYVNSTPQQNVYNEKNYTTAGDFVNSIVEGSILLAAGDVVSFRFQHNYASPITITLGQITANLEYNN